MRRHKDAPSIALDLVQSCDATRGHVDHLAAEHIMVRPVDQGRTV